LNIIEESLSVIKYLLIICPMFEYSASSRIVNDPITPLSKKIITEIRKHKTILDLGCVNGWLTHYIAKDADYIGVSYSQADIDAVVKKGHKGLCVNLDKDPIPLPDASVDCIYAGHIVEHFEKAELIGLMNECHRVLKK
jgi:SAM-dependent methyltransferase